MPNGHCCQEEPVYTGGCTPTGALCDTNGALLSEQAAWQGERGREPPKRMHRATKVRWYSSRVAGKLSSALGTKLKLAAPRATGRSRWKSNRVRNLTSGSADNRRYREHQQSVVEESPRARWCEGVVQTRGHWWLPPRCSQTWLTSPPAS